MSCVYKHTFPNGAIYIGKTNIKPEDRWLNGWGYKHSPLMFNAIIKFGWDNVKHEIIQDNLTEDEALELEATQIALHSAVCTVYNTSGVPTSTRAQDMNNFIDSIEQPLKPQQPHKTISRTTRPYGKDYIVPLTPKPLLHGMCPIDVYTKQGEFICQYPSAKIASQELNVNNGDVISCCKGVKSNGQPRYQVKGYIFRYATLN